jgi:tetratricopeptide (TPR) repeat protein
LIMNSMKQLLVVAAVAVSTFVHAQNKKTPAKPADTAPAKTEQPAAAPAPVVGDLTQHFYKKYATAIQWNDYDVAKSALYDLIVENPQNDSLILNLAFYYYENQKYASSALVSQELLARNNKNAAALELSAASFEGLGVMDRALQNYESLYLATNNTATLYKMAFIQYQLKRFTECEATADILLAKKDIDAQKVSFTDSKNQAKEYPMKVPVLNLKGMLAQEAGDKVKAKGFYDQVLVLAPDFQAAKENLAKLK